MSLGDGNLLELYGVDPILRLMHYDVMQWQAFVCTHRGAKTETVAVAVALPFSQLALMHVGVELLASSKTPSDCIMRA